MYPFIELRWMKLYMTWLWVVISLIVFIFSIRYLSIKYKKSFYSFFYWLPILIIFIYLLGLYFQFIFDYHILFPANREQFLAILNPYWYNFSFVWIILGIAISIYIFIAWLEKIETKKIWIDMFFSALAISLIPIGIFLIFWDEVIGKTTETWLSIKALHPESNLNKFQWVYPIGAFLSIASLLALSITYIIKQKVKKFWTWLLGFSLLILLINIILQFQSYPRFGVVSFGTITLDIKNYISFFVIMVCLYTYVNWNTKSK